LLSFLVHGDIHAPVIGLDKVPREYWPPVLVSFLAYHAMVGIGTFLIALTLLASFFRWRGTLFEKRWLLWIFVFAVVLAAAANELGWMSPRSDVSRGWFIPASSVTHRAISRWILTAC
jgi:cytochrome d ubiquinol oxidase subunit I